MARAKQPVSIDGIEFDALIDQSIDYSAEVPEYPTEEGFSVSDTIVLKPETISMTLFVTDTPVTWKQRFGSGSGSSRQVAVTSAASVSRLFTSSTRKQGFAPS